MLMTQHNIHTKDRDMISSKGIWVGMIGGFGFTFHFFYSGLNNFKKIIIPYLNN